MINLKPDEKPDTGKISAVAIGLTSPTFVDVATNTAPETTGLDTPQILDIETFTHFHYRIKVGKKTPENNYYMTLAINADIPRERPVGKDEKPEDKARLDKEFETQIQRLEAKFSQEKFLENWVYIVNSYIIDPLTRPRAQLMREKESPTEETPEEPENGIQDIQPE